MILSLLFLLIVSSGCVIALDSENSSLSADNDEDILSQSSNQNDDSQASDLNDDETNVEIGVDVIFDENDVNNNDNTGNSHHDNKESSHTVNLSDYPTNNPILLALIVIFTSIFIPFGGRK